jgi:K+-sensing histidine kinase KdpD
MRRIVFHRIVCAVDHPSDAVRVLDVSLQLAHLHGAQVRVLHVASRAHTPAGSVQRSSPDVLLAVRRRLADVTGRDVPVQWVVAHGNPAVEVARYASGRSADLVVIGRSSTSSRPARTEAIANEVLRGSASPVLVAARAGTAAPRPAPRHVLCSISSGRTAATFRYAYSLAQEFESRLTLLNVRGRESAAARSRLRGNVELLPAMTPATDLWCHTQELSVVGEPAATLAGVAASLRPDLIVVGASGTSVDSIGAVARAALGAAEAHVLIVPAPTALCATG